VKNDGKEESKEGAYTVAEDKFTLIRKEGDREHKAVFRIRTLTAGFLFMEDDRGRKIAFVRSKQ
jgi:hypothetical protein